MFTSLQSIIDTYHYIFDDNLTHYESQIIEIFNGYVNDTDDPCLLNINGLYYKSIKDYDQMKKYYQMAIEKNNSSAMFNLAIYYQSIKDYEQMMKYYLMAIEKGQETAMNNLASYYESIKDYEQMIKYYLMAIEKGNEMAMCNLAKYYESIKDYEQMKKYCLMAIEKDNKLIDKIKHLFKPLELYLLLNQKEQFRQTIQYKELLNNYDVIVYVNKCNLLKKENDCIVCMETNTMCIPLECVHYICISCYPAIIYSKKCPFCRLSICSSINK